MTNNKKEKVLVALSGGVASALTAMLLKKQGYSVSGVHFHLGSSLPKAPVYSGQRKFCDPAELEKRLGISVQSVDLSEKVDAIVLDRIMEEIWQGWRPQILAHLHHRVFFPELLNLMTASGCQKIATGHGTQVFVDPFSKDSEVHETLDPKMDQSVLLLGLKKQNLSNLLVPIGGFSKAMVLKLAREFGMETEGEEQNEVIPAEGKWLSNSEIRDWVRSRFSSDLRRSGSIQCELGNFGTHAGICNFTPGEPYPVSKEQQGESQKDFSQWKVLSLSPNSKMLTVGEEKQRQVTAVHLKHFQNWGIPQSQIPQVVDFRYRNDLSGMPKGMLTLFEADSARLDLPGSLSNLYLGQFVLIQKGDTVLGGGQVNRCELKDS